MSDYPVVRGPRSGDPHPRLRLAALTAVITGVLLVAVAAFLLSYAGIHQIALLAGVSPTLARLYPVMFDAMLVIACSAALALRSAGWPTRLYVWLSLLLLLGAVAAGDALYAMAISLPVQPTQAVVAIIPWVLLLMGFVMWLVMLRHWRRVRAAAANAAAGSGAAATATISWAGSRGRAGAAGGRGPGAAATPMRAAAPRAAIDTLLEPRPQRQTERTASSASSPAAKDDAATGTYPEKKGDRAGNGGQRGNGGTAQRTGQAGNGGTAQRTGQAGNGGTAQRTGQAGNGGTAQSASQTQGGEQAMDGGKAGNAGQAQDPGHAHEQGQDMHDDGTRTGLTYEAPESLSPETPSPETPSPETPSAETPSAETPSAETPSPETPSPETPSAETQSAEAPSPETPASGPQPSQTGTSADATMPEAGSGSYQPGTGGPGETGDQAGGPPMAPAPTPVPHFDRMRSTPTPPHEPEADEE
jgi:hypothetical protein